MLPDQEAINSILEPYVKPWYEGIANPQKAQERVLSDLLAKYAVTDYGQAHNVPKIDSISEYRANFPIINYAKLQPYLDAVKEGNYKAFMPEPPQHWVMTRGSTGKSKVLPATETHLKQIYSCGARAIINFAYKRRQYEVFLGVILNLNFPSAVHTMNVDGKR
jgi:hypothetical protein